MNIPIFSTTTQTIIQQELLPNISKINKIPKEIVEKIVPLELRKKFPEVTSKLIEDVAKTSLSKDPESKTEKTGKEYKIEKINELFKKLEIAMDSLNRIKVYKVPEDTKKIHFAPVSSWINKSTVLVGAMKEWGPLRLLSGKHVSLASLGAEHVMLNDRLGDDIDATYIDVKSFSEALKKFGGEKCLFKPNIQLGNINPFKGKHVKIKLAKEREIKALKIEFTLKSLNKTKQMENFYETLGFKVFLEQDGFYVISKEDFENYIESSLKESEDLSKDEENLFNQLSAPFRGYYFENYNQELADILNNIGFEGSPWTYKNIGGHGYLLREDDIGKIEILQKQSTINRYPISSFEPQETGTVLMAMNQLEVYEQYCPEMVTFLLEDANVMAYNNAGKGLSRGNADIANVQEAAEISYQFLHQVKKIPDDKILAKGQCFGGAPTAWLGAQHTDINLMIDQSPANFHEVARNKILKLIDLRKKVIKDHDSLQYKFLERLEASPVISDVVKALIMGFDLAEDIKKNQGNNLIHINLPTLEGVGGDKLVPEHHPELMIDSFAMKPDKIYKLSVNEGGVHVIDWFINPDSYHAVLQFLQKTNLAPNVSYNSELINKVIAKRKKFEDSIKKQIQKMDRKIADLNQQRLQGIPIQRADIDPIIRECLNFKTKRLQALAKVQNVLYKEVKGDLPKYEEFIRIMMNSVLIKPLRNQLTAIDAGIESLQQMF